MSQRQSLAILEALLRDDTNGLRANVERLITELPNPPLGNPGPLSADFVFYRAPLPGEIRPLTAGNIMLIPERWVTNTRIGLAVREGAAGIQIGYETAASSHEDTVDQTMLVATALVRSLDCLRDFSDANKTQFGSVIIDVNPGIDFTFGDFEGATTYGFLCRITIQEYSTDD